MSHQPRQSPSPNDRWEPGCHLCLEVTGMSRQTNTLPVTVGTLWWGQIPVPYEKYLFNTYCLLTFICTCNYYQFYRMLHLFPVFLIAKAPLFLKPLKLAGHVDIWDQVQDLLGQTLSHQLICEPCGEIHQFRTTWKENMTMFETWELH